MTLTEKPVLFGGNANAMDGKRINKAIDDKIVAFFIRFTFVFGLLNALEPINSLDDATIVLIFQ